MEKGKGNIMRTINIIGKEFITKDGSKFKVIEKVKTIKTETYYKIQFLDTKSFKIAEKRNIKKGSITDNFKKTIYGVACKGDSSSKKPILNKLAFKRWYATIERCYNPNSIGYKGYGAKGVRVSDDWLCFDNYLKDIQEIKGFDYENYINGNIQLDKDLLVKNNKIYSKDTCIFVEERINKCNQVSKQKKFKAISPEGKEYLFNNQSECARQFKLTARTIGKVLNNKLKTHKGWRFKYCDETDIKKEL